MSAGNRQRAGDGSPLAEHGGRRDDAEASVPPRLFEKGPRIWHLAPSTRPPAEPGPRVLIGGVGYWWQRDASFGLAAVDALAGCDWPPGIRVEKLDYGALYVALDLLDVDPPYDRLILVAGVERGREPGRLYVSRSTGAEVDAEEIQARILEAGAGVIDLDHLLVIARHFGALPADIVLIEFEPVEAAGGEELSPQGERCLREVVDVVRHTVLEPASGAESAAVVSDSR